MRRVHPACWYLLAFAFGFVFGGFLLTYLIFYIGDFS